MHSNNTSKLSMRIVTYLIEYLGEFEFIFETILEYESGDQMGSFDLKKPLSKISCLGTFKDVSVGNKKLSSFIQKPVFDLQKNFQRYIIGKNGNFL
jgi:hypothetical protein